MAKPLATILKKYSDVIAGKIPASEVSNLTLGKEPGVDYAPKMADEREFVASHSVEKHPDRVGNGPDVYSAANIKQTSAENGKHGHFPDPKSKKSYTQANEENQGFNSANRKTTLAERIGHKYGKVNEAKDSREYDYEGEMAVTKLKTIIRASEHLIKMMEPNTNLPEWVQSKIIKAEDYITTAHDYLMSEMNEAYDKNMSEMVCEACGDSYGKPTNESCKYDSKDKNGKNWVSKEQASAADKQPMYDGKKKKGRQLILDKDIQERKMTAAEKKKEESLKDKYDDSDMKAKMMKQYGAEKGKKVYFAYIRKKAMQKEQAPVDSPIRMPTNPSNQTAEYNSDSNLGNFTV